MLPKIAGYQGFQSYGDLQYPSLKSGKNVLSPNDVWEKTTREIDQQKFHDNNNYKRTIYQNQLINTVGPNNYKNHEHVKLGSQRGFFTPSKTTENNDNSNANNDLKVKTGVEHWKSNYTSGIKDPYAQNKATRPQWTLHKPPLQVNSKVGPSEYLIKFGELGTRPIDKLNIDGTCKIGKLDDDLKMGSTQSTYHVPGYTGFIPKANTKGAALIQSQAENPRSLLAKTSVVENFQLQIPGYAGHKPQASNNQRQPLREYCFSTTTKL